MGYLFFDLPCLDFSNVNSDNRDEVFALFGKTISLCISNRDNIYSPSSIHTHQFPFGSFLYNFLLSDYEHIRTNPYFEGISTTSYQLYISLLSKCPWLFQNDFDSANDFIEAFNMEHFGFGGFRGLQLRTPYIYSEKSWHEWKINWFTSHQNLIDWANSNNKFLPNLTYSDEFLRNEIIKEGKSEKLNDYNEQIGLCFHEEVMKKKGHEIAAYTIQIGKLVCEANYYTYEDNLSKAEQDYAKSLRNIYSIRNGEGDIQYISLDHRHGMFEYHRKDGKHLGEYKFDGSFNSKPDSSHDLKTL